MTPGRPVAAAAALFLALAASQASAVIVPDFQSASTDLNGRAALANLRRAGAYASSADHMPSLLHRSVCAPPSLCGPVFFAQTPSSQAHSHPAGSDNAMFNAWRARLYRSKR